MGVRRESEPWGAVPFALRSLSSNACKTWLCLDYYADWRGSKTPAVTVRRLAEDAGMSVPTVNRAIRELKTAGWLRTDDGKRKGSACSYALLARRRKPGGGGPSPATEGSVTDDRGTNKVVQNSFQKNPVVPLGRTHGISPGLAQAKRPDQAGAEGFMQVWPRKGAKYRAVMRAWSKLAPGEEAPAMRGGEAVAMVYKIAKAEERRWCQSADQWLLDKGWRTDLPSLCAMFGMIPDDLSAAERKRIRELLAPVEKTG